MPAPHFDAARREPAQRLLRVFFSVGDHSGDIHGANLIRELRSRCPGVEAVGYGGPKMAEAGCQLHTDLTALAVMWFLRVLLNFHTFLNLLRQADVYFRVERPDAVVLIDYPGFNWWIARRAKARGIPVFYYTPPQIWAWAQWRVEKMRRFVDHVLCSLPFEADWLRQRGCQATFVGHPFFDEVARQDPDAAFMAQMQAEPGPLVTILPGSRTQEVTHNLPGFLQAAAIIQKAVPHVRLAIASFKPQQAEMARKAVTEAGLSIPVYVGKTPELIRLADCCMAVSGSVSLELLAQAKPTVILYQVGKLGYEVQKWFRKVKYITLVNLLNTDNLFPRDISPYDPAQPDAHKVLFPEYLTCRNRSADVARHIVAWLTNRADRERLVKELERLRKTVAGGGASRRAADYILDRLLPAGTRAISFQPSAVSPSK